MGQAGFHLQEGPLDQNTEPPVNEEAGNVKFNAIGPVILGKDEVCLSQEVDEADGIGQGAFLHQVNYGVSEIRKGNHSHLGQEHMEECLHR